MPKVWRVPPFDEVAVSRLSAELKVPVLIAQVLAARGYGNGDEASAFLSAKLVDLHAPELLPGVTSATDLIVQAVTGNRRITIYGDYDVDGVTSTSILWHCLQLLGATVDYYIPHRLEEGYGLNCDAVRRLHEEDPQRLVITVDCGITSVKEAALARELGLELIVTDHHHMTETLPDASVLVHPRLPGGEYPFGDLCGAGVAFKLAWAICKRMGDGEKATPGMREFLLSAMGLAAVGTVADVVPLTGENRILVRYGLASLTERSSPGMQALMSVCSIENGKALQAEDIGFSIAPRINAAGRLSQARLAVELLTTEDQERAEALAVYLQQLNRDRQKIERKILKQAKEMVTANPDWEDASALVLASPDWNPGVIGIVATRIAEYFERPAVMVSLSRPDDVGQASCRTFAGFDLHAALTVCREHLVSYGGHRYAAGLKIEPANINEFRTAFCACVAASHQVTRHDLEIQVDAEVRLADLTWKAVRQIEELGPFGSQNPRPRFVASQVEVVGEPRKVGEGGRHLQLRLRHYGTTMKAIAFGAAEWAEPIVESGDSISICFQPTINRFRGSESVEVQLIDWQPGTTVNGSLDTQVATAS